jgi:hypothetical protein
MLAAIAARGLQRSTTVILSAKHDQSPDTPSALTRIPDGPIIDALDSAWGRRTPPRARSSRSQSTMTRWSSGSAIDRTPPRASPSASC